MLFGREKIGVEKLVGGAWAWERYVDDFLDVTWVCAKDNNAVGEINGFVEVMGDEEGGDVYVAPNL